MRGKRISVSIIMEADVLARLREEVGLRHSQGEHQRQVNLSSLVAEALRERWARMDGPSPRGAGLYLPPEEEGRE